MELNSNPQVRLVTEVQELKPLFEQWRALATNPMQQPEWTLNCWQAYRNANSQLMVLSIFDDQQQLIGIAPWCAQDHLAMGRSIRFIGQPVCTDFATILCRPEDSKLVAKLAAQWLQQQSNWSLLELNGVAGGDLTMTELRSQLESSGHLTHETQLENTWRVDLQGGWDAFLARVSQSVRRSARNSVKLFDSRDELEYRCIDSVEELEYGLSTLVTLHQARWQSEGQPGCFADERFTNFLRGTSDDFARQQRVRYVVLEKSGKPVAAQILLLDDTVAYMYQVGRDPAEKSEAFGAMLNYLTLKDLCDRGIGALDFLRGNEPYKIRLRAKPCECLRWRIARPAIASLLRHNLWILGRQLKHRFLAKPTDSTKSSEPKIQEALERK